MAQQNTGNTLKQTSGRLRIDYLDGLRGLAALYVLFSHVYIELRWRFGGVDPSLLRYFKPFDFAYVSVAVFIVLSGYCLMLPAAKSPDGKMRGGTCDYLKRRARRILPPYYAALVLSLALNAAVRRMVPAEGSFYVGRPDWDAGNLMTHLFLVHNLFPNFAWAINGPFWSVATEWQIYFLFPLLLLPAWRKAGILAAILIGFTVGLAPHFLMSGLIDGAVPWFLGLFALGMAGAAIGVSNKPFETRLRERIPWGPLSAVSWLGAAGFGAVNQGWFHDHRWIADPVVGFAAVALIIACTRSVSRSGSSLPLIVRLLDSRPAVKLGAFSYSLYLVHLPLLRLFYTLIHQFGLSQAARTACVVLIAVPLTILCAYLFHLAFERRFVSGYATKRRFGEAASSQSRTTQSQSVS